MKIFILSMIGLIIVSYNSIVLASSGTDDNITTENLPSSSENLFTSEEEESIKKADSLSDEDHTNILNASQKFLDSIDVELSTNTDADFDTNSYLTYGYDYNWIDNNSSIYSALNDIYRMILSIRNLLLVLICGLFIFWVHKSFNIIINRFRR